ncbi:THUMP domain-containing protein 2 isoform X2 [Gadus chalcogrammus]|uniref:THUMP domain-containing protein 2 isoform X2 n=1 Tax=Gadus chalcogrammus TaxID=1042646 RepID=UPI0024C4BBD5|nr:THUMP domain-containing protein 2 isoform X2 [Gadus chalcogrammus]
MAGSEPLEPLGLSRDLKGSEPLGTCRDLMGSEPLGPSRGLTEERRFFCTAGGGLEEVLVRELRTRLGAEEVCHVSGKVLFRTSAGMDALRRLKSAERLFLLVSRDGPVALPAHTCPGGEPCDWLRAEQTAGLEGGAEEPPAGGERVPEWGPQHPRDSPHQTAPSQQELHEDHRAPVNRGLDPRLAGRHTGWCVLDPMCGVGTILLEAAQDHKDVHFLGVDIDDGQLQRANENVAFADLRERIHLMKASCSGLPVCSSSVDAVVCDLPFGRKFNTKTNMADSLLCIVSEMERVLRPGGSLVLLLSPPMSCQLKKLQPGPRPGTQLPQAPGTQAPETQAPGTQPPGTQPPQDPQDPGLQAGPLSSLRLQATHRLSLGAIDGLVHSYVKRGAL